MEWFKLLFFLAMPMVLNCMTDKNSPKPDRQSLQYEPATREETPVYDLSNHGTLTVGLVSADRTNRCSSAYSCFEECVNSKSKSNGSSFEFPITTENICFCDSRCKMYGDCCFDYDKFCFNASQENVPVEFSVKEFYYSPQNYPDEDGIPYTVNFQSFECIKVDQYPLSAFWARTRCRDDWLDPYVEKLCTSPDPEDMVTQLPVIDSNKIVYRNAFCAECNHVWTYKFMLLDSVCKLSIPTHLVNNRQLFAAFLRHNCITYFRSGFSEPPRACYRTENTCPPPIYADRRFDIVRESCNSEIQFPLVDSTNLRNPVTYKNTGCATCNGLPPRSHGCLMVFPSNVLRNLPGSNSQGVIEHVDFCGKLFMSESDDLDSTDELHHVITNYNSDMTRTVVVNENDRYIVPIVHECPYGAVFDPFWGQCRQIHCGQGYVLENNQCVLSVDVKAIINEFTEFVSDVISSKNATPNVKLIITVNVSMDGKPVFEFFKNHSVIQRIIQFFNASEFEFWNRFENSTYAFYPVRPRWMNNTELDVTFNASGNGELHIVVTYIPNFPSFDLSRGENNLKELLDSFDPEDSVQVAADYEVYVDDKEVDTNGLDFKSFIIVVSEKFLKFWTICKQCNDTFSIRPSSELLVDKGSDPECLTVTIPGQSEWHDCNDTLFFSYDPDQVWDQQEFYVLICDPTTVLPPDCPRIKYNSTEYILYPNNTAVVDGGRVYHPGQYEISDTHLVVCSNFSSEISEIYVFFFGFSIGQIYMSLIFGLISDICLILTIVTYLIFRELRTLPGLNLLGLMIANMCCNTSLHMTVNDKVGQNICVASAILMHYFTLANLCWMTSIAFDAYLTFGGHKRRIFIRFKSTCPRKKRYVLYSVFGWGVPGLVVGLGILFNFCECGPFPMWYGRYISCWINDPNGFIFLFTIPASIILLSNYTLFIFAIHGIKSSKFNSATKYNSANAKKDIAVYIKLLTTTGFGWIFGYAAALSSLGALWTLFLVLVCLQGVFIFLAFFCNKRVLMLYVSLVRGTRKGRHTRASTSTGVDSPRSSVNKISVSEEVRFKTFGKSEFGLEVNSILERKEIELKEGSRIGTNSNTDDVNSEGSINKSEENTINKATEDGDTFEEVFL